MMTEPEAREFRARHDADVRRLSRMSRARLAETDAQELASRGIQRLYGQLSKDELIAEILGYRYPREQYDETTHILYHKPGEIWSACDICTKVS